MLRAQLWPSRIFILAFSLFGVFFLSGFNNSRHEYWWLLGLGTLGTFVFSRHRLVTVALLSILFHFIPDPLSRFLFTQIAQGSSSPDFFLFHIAGVLFSLALSYSIVSWTKIRKNQSSHDHFVLILVYFLLLTLVALAPRSELFTFLLYSLLLFARFLWPLCHLLISPPKDNPSSSLLTTGLLAPFWSFMLYYLPIPLSPVVLQRYLPDSTQEIYDSQKSGMKLLFYSILMFAIHNALLIWLFKTPAQVLPFSPGVTNYLLQHSLALPDVYLSFSQFPHLQLSWAEKFLAIWGKDILFILELFPTFGVAIALARLCGFRLPRMIYRPLQATSFVQYMGSFLYYYQQVILKLFFEPFFKFFKAHNKVWHRWSARFAIFWGLLVGGLLFHILRDSARLFGALDLMGFLTSYLQIVPYFIVIGLLAAFSNRRPLKWPAPLRSTLYFLIHPLVIFGIMVVTRFQSDLSTYLRFLSTLFGR